MEEQQDLFSVTTSNHYGRVKTTFGSPALARNTDPETSQAAAEAMDTTKSEQEVYEVILSKGVNGATLDEVCATLSHRRESSISPRFAPLVRKKLIYDSGIRRLGEVGRHQRVMIATLCAEDV